MRRKRIFSFAVVVLLLLGVGITWIRRERELLIRAICVSVLRSTGSVLGMYCEDYNGNLPGDFSLMGTHNYLSNASLYIWPRDSRKTGDWKNIKEWMDYIYIPWPSTTEAYAKYPLMYDRCLSNHGGKGVNVLLVEQVVHPAVPPSPESFHGQFFWDEGAQWLQKFAEEHPEYNIPLPEDLRNNSGD